MADELYRHGMRHVLHPGQTCCCDATGREMDGPGEWAGCSNTCEVSLDHFPDLEVQGAVAVDHATGLSWMIDANSSGFPVSGWKPLHQSPSNKANKLRFILSYSILPQAINIRLLRCRLSSPSRCRMPSRPAGPARRCKDNRRASQVGVACNASSAILSNTPVTLAGTFFQDLSMH